MTKAFALARLCRRLGVDASEVVAVGDMPNDLAMLQWAGTAVAVANATQEVLDAADEVTAPTSRTGWPSCWSGSWPRTAPGGDPRGSRPPAPGTAPGR